LPGKTSIPPCSAAAISSVPLSGTAFQEVSQHCILKRRENRKRDRHHNSLANSDFRQAASPPQDAKFERVLQNLVAEKRAEREQNPLISEIREFAHNSIRHSNHARHQPLRIARKPRRRRPPLTTVGQTFLSAAKKWDQIWQTGMSAPPEPATAYLADLPPWPNRP
jgi:hypothetical protein